MLGQWDAQQYLHIAVSGYGYRPGHFVNADGSQEPAAWFPGYGLAIRYVGRGFAALFGTNVRFGGSDYPLAAAIAITMVSGLATSLLFWKWMSQRGVVGRARLVSLFVLLWYPYAHLLYGAGYSDTFFLALVLAAFVLWEADRPISAGLMAAMAAVVRINGLALIAALALMVASHPAVSARFRSARAAAASLPRSALDAIRVRPALLAAPVLAASGLATFVIWCGVRYGEPLMYWNAHKAIFGAIRATDAEALVKVDYFPSIVTRFPALPGAMVNRLTETVITFFCAFSIPAVKRRFGIGYAGFVTGQIIIIWFASFDFIGAGRYLICVFPVAALWGERLAGFRWAPRLLAVPWLCGSVALAYFFMRSIDLGW